MGTPVTTVRLDVAAVPPKLLLIDAFFQATTTIRRTDVVLKGVLECDLGDRQAVLTLHLQPTGSQQAANGAALTGANTNTQGPQWAMRTAEMSTHLLTTFLRNLQHAPSSFSDAAAR